MRPATTRPHLTAEQANGRHTAAAAADRITTRAGGQPTRVATDRYDVVHATIADHPWARDIIRDAAAMATAPRPDTLQIGRTRTAGIVAVVMHADAWSLVIRPRRRPDGALAAAFTLAFTDTERSRYRVAWRFDHDCSVDGIDWSDMTRAVLTAIR